VGFVQLIVQWLVHVGTASGHEVAANAAGAEKKRIANSCAQASARLKIPAWLLMSHPFMAQPPFYWL
jgi:hypothetical protein